jgi:hypothetical protein
MMKPDISQEFGTGNSPPFVLEDNAIHASDRQA